MGIKTTRIHLSVEHLIIHKLILRSDILYLNFNGVRYKDDRFCKRIDNHQTVGYLYIRRQDAVKKPYFNTI
jgi:hypothetical protein